VEKLKIVSKRKLVFFGFYDFFGGFKTKIILKIKPRKFRLDRKYQWSLFIPKQKVQK
jgi:hypothetical protein